MVTELEQNSSSDENVAEAPAPPKLYLNRQVSWLEFNSRVLQLAADKNLPLFERLRFLSIFSTNLDEFFMKRVGGFKRQLSAGVEQTSIDGLSPRQQLTEIRKALLPALREQEQILLTDILPLLESMEIKLISWKELSRSERANANKYFKEKVFPLLTPLAVDSGHPFPLISNLSTSIGVALTHPEREETLFARIKISGIVPQWIPIGEGKEGSAHRFLSLTELVRHNVQLLFPHMNVIHVMPFRVTRNGDLEVDTEDAEDLMEAIAEELHQRRFAQVVRLEHGPNPDPWILGFLMDELELTAEDVYEREGPLDYTDFGFITSLDFPDKKFKPWIPQVPPALLEEGSFFSILQHRDVFVHHPYESFSASVERFIREAAEDPKVLSIKMVVYRVGNDTPILPLLARAAEKGKQVVCLVELTARFDEQQNMHWAQVLEEAGVHVVYGIPGLKTHAKTTLVVRQEQDGVRCYAHFGTGNYHARTANLYTDLGIFTAKPEFTGELVHLFNYLTGRSLKDDYQKLLVAPVNMERSFLALVEREIESAKKGEPARIVAKMNSLEDHHMIQALYRASEAGVQVDLFIRGICCLRPQVAGLSENVRVISVLGRFLEHSRVYAFLGGHKHPIDGQMFIASADWMSRNLHRRVELGIPVEDRSHRERCWEILQVMFEDYVQAWEMNADGTYTRRRPPNGKEEQATHDHLMRLTRERNPFFAHSGEA